MYLAVLHGLTRSTMDAAEWLMPMRGTGHAADPAAEHDLLVGRWPTRARMESAIELEKSGWVTTHVAFESAYREGLAEAPRPVAYLNVIDVAAGSEPIFEETFKTRQGNVEDQPGFLSLEVLRPLSGNWHAPLQPAEAMTYVVFSRWASAEAHAAWTRSEAFSRAHGRRPLLGGTVVRARVLAFSVAPAIRDHLARAHTG